MSPSDAATVARAFFDSIGSGDPAAAADLVDDHVRWSLGSVAFALRVAAAIPGVIVPESGVWEGKEAAFTHMLGPVTQAFGQMQIRVHEIIAQDDRAAVLLHVTAVLASGRKYANDYSIIMRVRDGKLVEVTEYTDTLSWVTQFSPTPEPATT